MTRFTTTTNHSTAIKEIQLPRNSNKRIHLVGIKARVSTDITLSSSDNITATIKKSPFNGPKGIWIVDIKGKKTGTLTLEAKYDNKSVASVDITVFNKVLITLAQPATAEGLLTRLFLAESINPGKTGVYNAENSKKSMLWMRKVIENRLSHKTPHIFSVPKKNKKDSYTIFDIVKAKNQFHGFEKYPDLDSAIKRNISAFISNANNYNHSLRKQYADFIANAKNAASANALKNFNDPGSDKLFGWRTKGSSVVY